MYRWKIGLFIWLVLLGIGVLFYALRFFNVEGIKVYCPESKRHIYTITSDVSDISKDNVVSAFGVRAFSGGELVCPFDDVDLNGYKYWFSSRDLNEPRLSYRAVTVMTKDSYGGFVWYPYEVDLVE